MLMVSSMAQHDMRYIHALLLSPDYGMVEWFLPYALAENPHLLKSSQHDPDTPDFHEAMSGPHREEFVEAMENEIKELEAHNTWTVVSRSLLPEGANAPASTWAFKIKRYPADSYTHPTPPTSQST